MSEAPIAERGAKPWEADHEMDVARVCLPGDDGLGAALERYDHPFGAGLRDRARFIGVYHAVSDAWGLQRGLDGPVAQARAALERLA